MHVSVRVEADDLLQLFDWLTKLWCHLNEILEDYCEPDSTVGECVNFANISVQCHCSVCLDVSLEFQRAYCVE